jgi:uncharacterized alpha-E superfamily protein
MLSRVANSIYWMSRYIERAENTARLIDVNLQLTLDRPGGIDEQWNPLVAITGDDALFATRYPTPDRTSVMQFLTFDPDYPNSIVNCIAAARENARTIRDVITSEMWQQINTLHLMLRHAATTRRHEERPHEFYTEVKRGCQLFDAITDGTMSHGIGWDFARLGRMTERADKTSRILDVKYFLLLPRLDDVGGPMDVVQWAALLRSAGALEMYRQHHGAIHPPAVVGYLMLDTEFPRSLAFCLLRAQSSLHRIIGPHGTAATHNVQRLLGRLRSDLEFGDAQEIIDAGLHEYLDHFQSKLNQIDDAINRAFFQVVAPKPAGTPLVAQGQA